MDNYRLAFIYGNDDQDKNILDGQIKIYGEIKEDLMHSKYLLNYVKEYHSDQPIFNNLSIKHPREIIAYFLVKMGHIVFFNTSRYDEKNMEKYGKTGQFMIPDNLTEKQRESLFKFLEQISDYQSILFSCNLKLSDGLLDDNTYLYSKDENIPLKEVVEKIIGEKKNIQR